MSWRLRKFVMWFYKGQFERGWEDSLPAFMEGRTFTSDDDIQDGYFLSEQELRAVYEAGQKSVGARDPLEGLTRFDETFENWLKEHAT